MRALSKEDFHRPPLATIGDGDRDKIHLAAGKALHAWESVENHLGGLFAAVIGTVVPVAVLRAYGSITGSDQRRKMLIEAAETVFADLRKATGDSEAVKQAENEFNRTVKNVCQEAAARRNEIAHGLVIYIHNDRCYFLQPSYRSSRHRDRDLNPVYSYTSKEIDAFRHKFDRLAFEVFELVQAVYGLRGLQAPST